MYFLGSAIPLYTAMWVGGLVRITHTKNLLSKPLRRPVSTVQVYTRLFTWISLQPDQAMCVCYKWVKQSACALPSIGLR